MLQVTHPSKDEFGGWPFQLEKDMQNGKQVRPKFQPRLHRK